MEQRKRRVSGGSSDLTEGVIWKQLLAYFFPILLGTFFQLLYNTVDAVIVGNFVGKGALAAVGGPTAVLISLIVGFFVGVSSGAAVIISQYYGARRPREVSDAVHTAVALSLVVGAFLTLVGVALAEFMLRAISTPEDIMADSATYLRVYFAGSVPMLLYNMGAGILRAVGDARRPLYYLVICCLLNIVLDLLLVCVFPLGVLGVALATLLSQAVSAVLVFIALWRADDCYRLFPRKIRFHRAMLARITRIGLPAGLQSAMYSISNTIIQRSVNTFGTDVVAAWSAYAKIDAIFFSIIGAIGVSVATFVGQNYGAGKPDRVRRSIRVGFLMAAGVSVVLSGSVYALGGNALRLFIDDAAVLEVGQVMVHTLVPAYITFISIELLASALRGMGDTLVPMLLTIFGICVFRILWIVFVLPYSQTIVTVILCYPITWTLTSCLFILYYRRKRRKIGDIAFPPAS